MTRAMICGVLTVAAQSVETELSKTLILRRMVALSMKSATWVRITVMEMFMNMPAVLHVRRRELTSASTSTYGDVRLTVLTEMPSQPATSSAATSTSMSMILSLVIGYPNLTLHRQLLWSIMMRLLVLIMMRRLTVT